MNSVIKNIIIITAICLLVLSIGIIVINLPDCSNEVENGSVTCEQKDFLISENDAILVDVRTKEEYDAGHLDNAINAPYDEVISKLKKYDKDTPIIVYCRSGNRSAKAYQSLQDAGYTKLYDLGSISNCG